MQLACTRYMKASSSGAVHDDPSPLSPSDMSSSLPLRPTQLLSLDRRTPLYITLYFTVQYPVFASPRPDQKVHSYTLSSLSTLQRRYFVIMPPNPSHSFPLGLASSLYLTLRCVPYHWRPFISGCIHPTLFNKITRILHR